MFADRRAAGAIAGLGPAAVILGYYLLTGGPVQPGLLTIVAAATAAGWLTGPRVGHGTRQDVLAAVAYLLVGYLLERVTGVAITSWGSVSGVAGDPPPVLEAIGIHGVVTIVYLPVWGIVLAPLAILWMLTVRALSGHLRPGPDGVATSRTLPRPPAQAGSLLWPPIAAVIAYILGFMLVAPWGCSATSTVGVEGSGSTGTTVVCSSLIGAIYSGQGSYSPPREPAIQAGLAVAAITFVIVLVAVLWMRRDGRVGASG